MHVLIQVWIGYNGYNRYLHEPFHCNWINDYGILKGKENFVHGKYIKLANQ